MLMGQIRRSSHIMGFDKVKINTTSLLLLPLARWGADAGSAPRHTQACRNTRSHTSRQTPRQPSLSFSPRHLCCTLNLTHPFLSLTHTHTFTHPRRFPQRRCLCPRHKHPSILPPFLLFFSSDSVCFNGLS